jgi:hypothetical protein
MQAFSAPASGSSLTHDDDRFGMFRTADHELFVNEQDVIERRHDTVAWDRGSSHALGGALRMSMRPQSVLHYFAEDNNPVLADESADRRREKKKKTGTETLATFAPRMKHLPLRDRGTYVEIAAAAAAAAPAAAAAALTKWDPDQILD